IRGLRGGLELAGGLEPGQFRELDVHDDQVRPLRARGAHPPLAAGRLDQAVGGAAEQLPDDLAIEFVILDVQDRLHAGASWVTRTGIVKKKGRPLPGWLCTAIR